MATRVYVDDVAVERERGSIRIMSAIERRSTASVIVWDEDSSKTFERGQKIDFLKDTLPPFVNTLFSGVIGSKPIRRRIPGTSSMIHELSCVDWHYLADKRLVAMAWEAAEYENYTAGDDGAASVFGINWYGQTLPTATAHQLSKIRLMLYRVGNPGTVTISLRAVDGGLDPTGADLAVGTLDGNSLTADTAGAWAEVNMTIPYSRVAATTYAVIVRATDGDAANYVGWRKNSGGAFANGEYEASGDSGATWTPDNAQDFMFETWYYPTAGMIARDIHSIYLAAEGVTVGNIESGPDIKEMIVNYQYVTNAFDVLSARSGFIWEIDYFKQLNFQARATTEAWLSVAASDIRRPSSSLAKDSSQYRNRQFIRGGTDVTEPQVETFTGDGTRESFTVGYRINQVPTVTVNAVGQTVGIKGIDTTMDCYWSKGDSVIVFDVGSVPGAVAVVISYIGEYDIMVQAEDAAEIASRVAIEGGTGLIESISDEPYLVTSESALEQAQAMLVKFGVIGQQFTFAHSTWGLAPGELITMTVSEYGLAATSLLVESITITEFAPDTMAPEDTDYSLLYTVKAIEGPVMGDWTGLFRALAGWKSQIVGRVNVGADQVLLVLALETGNWEVTEVVTPIVNACPIPSVALFPSGTLYPC